MRQGKLYQSGPISGDTTTKHNFTVDCLVIGAGHIPPITEDDTILVIKWNDAFRSKQDCGDNHGNVGETFKDDKLDEHKGFPTYLGSGAWLTTHQQGAYEENGEVIHWTFFGKMVAAPADAYVAAKQVDVDEFGLPIFQDFWYSVDGEEIGWVIYDSFAIIQEILNDPGTGDHGVFYKGPVGPGFGKFWPWK